METSKRLFIGIELPPVCKMALRDLDPHLPGLRWQSETMIHLTLSFLGDVGAGQQGSLAEELRKVRVPPFLLPLQKLGSFGPRGRPTAIWIGVGNGHPHLFALHHHIQDAVLRARLDPDLTPFVPHVTIGRAKGISGQMLQPFLRKHRDAEFGMFPVTEFALFSTVFAVEGTTHPVELRVPL